MVKIKFLKLKDFLEELPRSQKVAKKLMEIAKEAIKKQFNKKRENVWLEANNIHLN